VSRALFALPAALLALSACGPQPELRATTVELAIDFSADALLEVAVHEQSSADCAALLGGGSSAEPLAVDRQAAGGLNGGGSVTLELPELPADVPLAFYASATEAGTLQAEDCRDDVTVPAGGTVEVQLVVGAP
jgi:hypothetical protein